MARRAKVDPMRFVARGVLALIIASASLSLAGCDDAKLMDFFDAKKKLSGERKPVFPEGVPGVQQGVPPELMKGYTEQQNQAAAAAADGQRKAQEAAVPEPEQPKPKPKPKRVAQPKPPAPQAQQAAPVQQQQQAQPGAPVQQSGLKPWPDSGQAVGPPPDRFSR
jgi:hypothetical protein